MAKASESKKTCFVICPIGNEDTDTRKRSDQVLKYIVNPVLELCNYSEITRADKISKSGIISAQIIQHLLEDDLVIADLTAHNPNVMYELAIRHLIKKPFIHMIHSDEQIPFDIAGNRTIKFDYKDLDSVENCKIELEKQVRSIDKSPQEVDNPISIAVDLKFLKHSDNPETRLTADLLNKVSELSSVIYSMSSRLEKMEYQNKNPYKYYPVTFSPEITSAQLAIPQSLREAFKTVGEIKTKENQTKTT